MRLGGCSPPDAWFPPFRCRSAVAVSPLPLRKFRKRRKNYVAYVKNSVAPLPLQLPLCRNRRSVANRIESYFCRSAVARQPISVLVTSSNSTASTERRFHQFRSHRIGNGSYGTELRQRYNGTVERHNGTAKRQRQNGNGRTATEGWKDWKPGITRYETVRGRTEPGHIAVVNHGNTEITETVIFVKCRESRDFARMPCFCRVFCQNAVVLPFLQEYFVFNQHKLKFIV